MTRIRRTAAKRTHMETVRFRSPVLGLDPIDGTTFTADRHRIAAVRCRQDAVETVFIDDDGLPWGSRVEVYLNLGH